jgi:hypothetical protein
MKIVMWNAADFKTVGDHVSSQELIQAKTPKEIMALARLVLPRLPIGATRDKLDVGKLATQLNHMAEEKRSQLNCDMSYTMYDKVMSDPGGACARIFEKHGREVPQDYKMAWLAHYGDPAAEGGAHHAMMGTLGQDHQGEASTSGGEEASTRGEDANI